MTKGQLCGRWFAAPVAITLLFSGLSAQVPVQSLPDGPEARTKVSLEDAKRLFQAERFADAEAKLRLFLAHNGQSSEAQYMLGYAELRQGKAKEALDQYTRAASLSKPNATDLLHVAQAYVLLADYPDAEKWLLASLRMDPNDADVWYNLGRLRYTQNRFAEAVQCYEKALALSPRSVKAEDNLGLALEGLNRPKEAEQAYRQALAWQDQGQAKTASEQPYLNLAILILHDADYEQAAPLLQKAVAIAPNDPRIHEQLGQLYLREERFPEASLELKTATSLAPNRPSLHFLLGQAYRHLGQSKEASAEFAEAARLSKIFPENGSQ